MPLNISHKGVGINPVDVSNPEHLGGEKNVVFGSSKLFRKKNSRN